MYILLKIMLTATVWVSRYFIGHITRVSHDLWLINIWTYPAMGVYTEFPIITMDTR